MTNSLLRNPSARFFQSPWLATERRSGAIARPEPRRRSAGRRPRSPAAAPRPRPGRGPDPLGQGRRLLVVVADLEPGVAQLAAHEGRVGRRGRQPQVVGGRGADRALGGEERLVAGDVGDVDIVAQPEDPPLRRGGGVPDRSTERRQRDEFEAGVASTLQQRPVLGRPVLAAVVGADPPVRSRRSDERTSPASRSTHRAGGTRRRQPSRNCHRPLSMPKPYDRCIVG